MKCIYSRKSDLFDNVKKMDFISKPKESLAIFYNTVNKCHKCCGLNTCISYKQFLIDSARKQKESKGK